MLIAKIFINEKQIDEINVHNTGKKYGKRTEYQIMNMLPLYSYVYHERKDGWEVLLEKALRLMNYKI